VQAWRIHRRNERLIKKLSKDLKGGDYMESIGAYVDSGTQIFKKM